MKTREKLKTYFIGFGIGLILVGLMLFARGKFAPPQPPGQQPSLPSEPQPNPEGP